MQSPRATPLWLVMMPTATPARAEPVERRTRRGQGSPAPGRRCRARRRRGCRHDRRARRRMAPCRRPGRAGGRVRQRRARSQPPEVGGRQQAGPAPSWSTIGRDLCAGSAVRGAMRRSATGRRGRPGRTGNRREPPRRRDEHATARGRPAAMARWRRSMPAGPCRAVVARRDRAAVHQRVVGVPRAGRDADEPGAGRTGCTRVRCHGDGVAGGDQAKAQVGVLPVGPGEALVEAADRSQRRRGAGHVGGDPRAPARGRRRCAPSRWASGGPAGGRRPALDCAADRRRRGARSATQVAAPAGSGTTSSSRNTTHGADAPPADVASRRRAAPAARSRDGPGDASRVGSASSVERAGRSSTTMITRPGRGPPSWPASTRSSSAVASADGRHDDGRHDVVRHGADVRHAKRPARRDEERARSRGRRSGAEPKHSSASRGSSTIGRPAVFSDVLTTTGRPVRCSKARDASVHERLVVRRRRSGSGPCRRRGRRPGSARATPGATRCVNSMCGLGSGPPAKISPARSSEHHRRDRPELLAALDVVEPLEVLGVARVGEQAAVAERPGPNSLRPWNQATIPSAASTSATASAMSAGRRRHAGGPRASASSSSSVHRGPSAAVAMGWTWSPSAAPRGARRRARCRRRRRPAAPRRRRRVRAQQTASWPRS